MPKQLPIYDYHYAMRDDDGDDYYKPVLSTFIIIHYRFNFIIIII